MERDFMGLSNRQQQPLRKVKQEIHHDTVSPLGLCKSSAVEWTKLNGSPNLMSAREFHEGRAFAGASVVNRITTPSPTLNSFVGFAHPRRKAGSGGPQLTVFYAGKVNVFNDISPEKAQAIMLWAGKGLSVEEEVPKGEMRSRRRRGKGGVIMKKKKAKECANDAASSSSSSAIHLIPSFSPSPNFIPPSVPLARKASLARFLEKRKERLMNAAAMPYSMMSKMKLMEQSSTGESTAMNYYSPSSSPP